MVVRLRLHLQCLTLTSVTSRCSDGVDRHRQEWLDYGCPEQVRPAQVSYNQLLVLWP